MATTRDGLYSRFRFLLDIGDTGQGPDGGFDKVSGVGGDAAPSDYRDGSNANARQIAGVVKATTVTLKSGVIKAIEFRRWLDDSRTGERSAARTVTIQQRDTHHVTAATWKLVGARIIKHSTGPLNVSDTHIVIEELGLACDGVELVEG